MANQWGIPAEIERIVNQRDRACVYCGVVFSQENTSRKNKPSWEHIVNDVRINGENNIALCCMSCNASKGATVLEDWLVSNYCRTKGIKHSSVAQVVKNALSNPPTL